MESETGPTHFPDGSCGAQREDVIRENPRGKRRPSLRRKANEVEQVWVS